MYCILPLIIFEGDRNELLQNFSMRIIAIVKLFSLLVLLHSSHLYAYQAPISYLTIENGLSNNSVRCIYQDHNGFMWFGTYDGLNRYDGYEFKVFRNRLNDTNSLPHNYIYCINEDLNNNLWIGTGQGVGIYNNLTSKFLPAFYFPHLTKVKQKITYNVNAIKTDAKGNIFIGTNGGGLLFQKGGTNVAVQLAYSKAGGRESTGYNVQAILIDRKQRVWLFIRDVGLCLYNYADSKIQLVNGSLKSANSLVADGDEDFWMGTYSGLHKYSILSNSLVKSYYEGPGQLSSDNVASLSFDKQKNLWIGTEGGGVNILDTRTGRIDYILPGENKSSLTSKAVVAIYNDNEDRKWIGTLKGGINKIDPLKNQFQTVAHDRLNSNSLIYNFVSAFYEGRDKNIWIGTDGGGMSVWDRKQNTFRNFKHSSNGNSLSSNSITCIKEDYLNHIWIATFGGGINRFIEGSNVFEHYKCINEVTGEENGNVWLLYEDRENNLWATTFANGRLYRFNRRLNRFDAFDQNLIDLISIIEDQNGALWAGNSHQLIKIDKQNKKHKIFEIGKPVRAIYEDKRGNFWIGSEGGGLILFNRQQGKIAARYSDVDGLSNNAVLNILDDNKGNLWLSTFNGLSRFNPANKTFKNFHYDDGLQSNQFLYNGAFRLQSGEFMFGGIQGFNIFNPDSIISRKYTPAVILTGLRINNVLVSGDSKYVTRIEDDKIEALEIPFNEAVLSFDFAALEYSAPGKISYRYYLEGWDKGWNYSTALRTANYTNVREGHYVLRVKSTNAEGVWNPKEITVKIIVLPPWYRSWWAYLFYAIIAGASIYLYLQYRAKQAKLEYQIEIARLNADKERAELERERSDREKAQAEYEKTQAEYEKEKAERETERVINEREKEINEKKLSFFTDVSHEFRTPLTLIINPLKDLLGKTESNEENKELNIVYRNARRLLSLVDQLLLFRKADTGADRLKISKLDFIGLCEEVFLSFVQHAKSKKIKYEFDSPKDVIEVYADKEKIEIALFNLISNALKYTQEDGKVCFRIDERNDYVEVSVIDNGPGIPKDVGDKLFDKFYRVHSKSSSSKIGFGIGLYLVKHFVEAHQGEVRYESEPGEGMAFYLTLKKGADHFDNHLIQENFAEKSNILQELLEEPVQKEDKSQLEVLVTDKQSLLIVDDDPQLRQYIAQIFNDKFVIYEAESGEEGLKLAEQNIPDIIISDVTMGEMNGIELIKSIKATASLSHIPVILLTGTSSKETQLKGAECGADDYITKPFEKEFLLARVENILKSRSVLHNYFYNEITLQKNTLKVSVEYKEFLDRCIHIVEQHLDDSQFSIQTLASEIGMSHSALYKRVKSISGQSVREFIRFIRLRKAAELLITTDHNVNEVAFEVGINDIKYFRSSFNKLFGMNPSEYIKKFRKPFRKNFTLSDKAIKTT